MRRLGDWILLSYGWKRLAIAFGAGAASALAMPPYGFFPVLALTLPVLVVLLDGVSSDGDASPFSRTRAAFVVGWAFGFGYFIAGLWWIGAAFLVESDVFAWALPIGVAGLPAVLALFTGVGVAAARFLWSSSPWRVAALAFGLGTSEYLRGIVATGFPWNALGYALTMTDVQMQAASLIGVTGLTFVGVFAFAAVAVLFDPPHVGPRSRVAVLVVAAGLLGGQVAFGAVRLAFFATDDAVPGVVLRLVQPNLTQRERLDRTRHEEVVDRLFRLSQDPPGAIRGARRVTHLIWPESTFPFLVTSAPRVLARIGDLLEPGTALIAGAARLEEQTSGGTQRRRFFNSLYVFDDDGRIADRYDKVHLVPFGEYLPFQETLEAIGLQALTRQRGGFSAGARRLPVSTGIGPAFGPLICYEVIFPGAVAGDGARPSWYVNLSDDSWFGDTPGPRQHMHQARVRATEEGTPIARVTTTGFSAIVDSYGRLRESAIYGIEARIDGSLPVALPPPPFVLAGNWIIFGFIATTLLIAALTRFSLRRRRS
jgi:apolipoprotein N-acyltransferase